MLTRRRFLTNTTALGVTLSASPLGAATSAITVPNLSGYRALVCIYLAGGSDSFNMLVPTDRDQYSAYCDARSNLALNRSDLLAMAGRTASGRIFSLHPGMRELRELYDNGDAAFLANVGTLRRPFNADALQSNCAALPGELLSHTGQIGQWQTCGSESPSSSGWAGRMADVLQEYSSSNDVSMNLSLSGANIFQLGSTSSPCNFDAGRPMRTRKLTTAVGVDFDFINSQMAEQIANSGRAAARKRRAARRKAAQAKTRAAVATAVQKVPDLQSKFAADPLSQQLAAVAQIIAARDTLESRRQIFYVSFSGWDHHHQLLSSQAIMLPVLSQGLLSFRDVLRELGVFNDVTTFTVSEFGRSMVSNGSGSDHGWGGHQIIMGNAVAGAKIFGNYPDLSQSSPVNIGDGVYAPTTSNDEYFAELALWMGVPFSQLDYVLPNLHAFRSPNQEAAPLGFFA
jgi:uncharacterized protein (DUF1501 family)